MDIRFESDSKLRKFFESFGCGDHLEGELIGFGAYKDSELVGSIALLKCQKNKSLPSKYYLQVAVIENERMNGIATALYKALFQFPLYEIFAEIEDSNLSSKKLAERFGFKFIDKSSWIRDDSNQDST